jgi:hypothetical protein
MKRFRLYLLEKYYNSPSHVCKGYVLLGVQYLLVLCLGFSIFFTGRTLASSRLLTPLQQKSLEVLYMPSGEALRFMSFGFRNFLSDIIWFRTINYFGKHFRTDKDYEWLYHMCTLVTQLNPKAKSTYQFGAAMLAWESQQIERSTSLLNSAIKNMPEEWLFWYLRGFNRLYFEDNAAGAHSDFVEAARLPHAHPVVALLAAKTVLETGSEEVARALLEQMMRSSADPLVKQKLQDEIDSGRWRKKVLTKEEREKRLQESLEKEKKQG